MTEMTTFLTYLHPLLTSTHYRQLIIISEALLRMTGRITPLSISRWTGKGGSYRTIQRFFMSNIQWDALNGTIIKRSLSSQGVILAAGDATTVTKSGKKHMD
jgi:putative transposase